MPELEIPDPNEIHEKAEDPFTRKVALAVAIYAVVLAIASYGGSNAMKEMILAKQAESNRWNQFQSKSTREALYRNEIWLLESEAEAAGGEDKLSPARKKLLEKYRFEEKRMKEDKDKIDKETRNSNHLLDEPGIIASPHEVHRPWGIRD